MKRKDDYLELQLRKLGNIPVPDSLLKNIQARLGQLTPEWADRQYKLAHDCRNLVEGDGQQNLVLAIAHFQNALHVYTPEAFAAKRVEVLYDLGCTYCDLSELPEKDRLTNLDKAVTSYKEALDVVREHHLTDEWVTRLDEAVSKCYRQRIQELEHRADIAKENGDESLLNHHLASALDHYVQALGLYSLLENHLDEGIVLQKIANIQHSLQNMDTAISLGKEVAFYRRGEANLSHIEGIGRTAVLEQPAHNETIVGIPDKGSHGTLPPDESEQDSLITNTDTIIVKWRPRGRILSILLILIVLITVGGTAATMLRAGKSNSSCAAAPSQLPHSAHGIGIVKTDANECIGLSDGSVAFDVNQPGRTDSILKQQAAEKLANGDRKDAVDLLQQAVKQERSDAEARIYLEDLQVLNSGQPYITLIVGTKITGENINPAGERSTLQGAYVAQQEYNKKCILDKCSLIRLLIANTGNDANNAKNVVNQIVQAAQSDHTIIGVEGWSVSQESVNMVSSLTAAHLPMVSSSASSDLLTGISPYFFRISPPDGSQGALGASYAMNTLHAHHTVVFVDQSNAYSWSLANAFKQHITGGSIDLETYTVGTYAQNKDLARGNLQDILRYHPDLIYFAGYPKDAAVLFEELQTYQQLARIPVMGGDAFGDLVSDPGQNVAGLDRLVFTNFATPGEWRYRDPSVQEPPFFQEYAQIFASGASRFNTTNGDNPPTGGAMLSYDAIRVLLQASQTAFTLKKTSLTGQDLQQALTNITGSQAFQGVSGQIAFGQDGNPQDKAVVILKVNKQGKVDILGTDGKFLLP